MHIQGFCWISDGQMGFMFIEDLDLFEKTSNTKYIVWARARTQLNIGMNQGGVDYFAESVHFEDGWVYRTKAIGELMYSGLVWAG
jgi:hypothetical protein